MSEFVQRLRPLVDATVEGLSKTKFREDPIGGRRYSRATSIISSAYKRHGQILEKAILERLSDCSRFEVWREDAFKLSTKSELEYRKHDYVEKHLTSNLPYGEEAKTIPVDAMVFDHERKTLRSYNVKRGNGAYDAGKRRQILAELIRVNMLLRGYGESRDIIPDISEARIIFYYGVSSIPQPLSLTGDELDDHFGFPIYDAIEEVNEYFKSKLYALIEDE